MTTPLTEEQRRKLQQLREGRQSSFDTGLDTSFDVREPVVPEPTPVAPIEPVIPTEPEPTQPILPEPTQPTEIAPIVDETPLVEDVPAVPPAGGAGIDPLTGGVETDILPEPAITPAPTPGIGFGQLQRETGDVFQQQIAATERRADIAAQEAIEMEPILKEKTNILEKHQEETKRIVDQAAANTQDQMSKIQGQVDELNKMEYKGFWQSKSTGEKILGALSVALGAYAQGLSGGRTPNTALAIMNKAMEDDFRQFQAKSNKKIQLIQQSRASLATKQAAVREELTRQEAYKVGQLGQLESKLGELSNKFKAPKAKEQANLLAAQINQSKIQLQAQLQAQIEAKNARDAQTAINKEKTDLLNKANLLKQKELKQKEGFTQEQGLRKEYNSLPEIKEAKKVSNAYERLRSVEKTPAGDLSLVFSYMKMLDPGSTVREGEFATASNAGDVSDRIYNLYNRLIEGEILTKEQRNDFVKQASNLNTATQKNIQPIDKQFKKIAKERGIDFSNIKAAPLEEEQRESRPAPHGQTVRQGGKLYKWDGTQYVEVK